MLLCLLLAGCAVSPPVPVAEEPPVAVPEPPAATVTAPKPPPPPPAPAPVTPPPPVTILISMDIPAYTQVAAHLARALGERAMRHVLDGDTARMLTAAADGPIVAIGLEAALLARDLQRADRPVVFCQVFNHVEHNLVARHMRGVALLPSFRKTFSTWRALAPALREVAVFTGPGFEGVMAPAQAAAQAFGIVLQHHSVQSDKEFLYRYKEAGHRIDGLWLVPDNRILSRDAIREAMSYSVRNGKQVAVFNEQLLPLGGLFSVTAAPEEVAAKVLRRLDDPAGQPAVVGLEEAVIRVNPVIARRLNLSVPEALSHHVVD